MISKEKRTSILYSFIALLFSIALYFNANGQSVPNTLSGNEAYNQTVTGCRSRFLMIQSATISMDMKMQ